MHSITQLLLTGHLEEQAQPTVSYHDTMLLSWGQRLSSSMIDFRSRFCVKRPRWQTLISFMGQLHIVILSQPVQVQSLETLKEPSSNKRSCLSESTQRPGKPTAGNRSTGIYSTIAAAIVLPIAALDDPDSRCHHLIVSCFCDPTRFLRTDRAFCLLSVCILSVGCLSARETLLWLT